MPLIINPDLMIIDDGEGAPRVSGPRTDTSKVSLADAEAASMQAGKDLGLTDAQLQESVTDPSQLTKITGESNAAFNARVTAAYKAQAQPELTAEQEAAGAYVKFVRSGAAGAGEYRILYPIGVGFNRATGEPTGINAFNFSGRNTDTIISSIDNGDGTVTTTWKSGRKETIVAYNTGNGKGNGTLDANGNPIVINTTGAPTTNIEVLKAALRGLGFTSAIIDQSTSFLNGLIRDGLDIDNATEVFLNSKEYTLKNGTKMTSPFYTEYGYLNDGLVIPKSASDLFNSVEGYKGVVEKYKLSTKYLSKDNLKLYVKNDVTVADLSERAAAAQLRAVEADPFQIKALMVQGYIASAADLTDFYLDAKIGKEQLELNRQTGVFTAEALRRAKSGISTSATQLAGFKQLTATLAAKGYSEAQISQLAGTGFENISETLQPTTAFAQMFEKAGGTVESNAALTEDIQSGLLAEEFTGTASQRRKRLFEQNVRSFQGQSGTTTGSLRTSSAAGLL